MTFVYFAYGSNMLSTRLTARCKSAQLIGVATAPGYSLEFTKVSIDGSGKATLAQTTPAAQTPGVLFKIDENERETLDKFEGAGNGYNRVDDFRVDITEGTVVATTYLASKRQKNLIPYDWYLALVVAGAQEHSFSQPYIDRIRNLKSTPDPKESRKSRVAAIQALKDQGHHIFLSLLSA